MPKHSHAMPLQLRGKVSAFNISPKGHIEGLLITTSTGLAQVNFPKHEGAGSARSIQVGAKVTLRAELESDDQGHPVYRLCEEDAEVTGTVTRLNYALHGEVNGCHLDDETFVHLKPEGAKKYKLRVGDKVTASGTRRTGPDAVVLELRTLEKGRETTDAGKERSASRSR